MAPFIIQKEERQVIYPDNSPHTLAAALFVPAPPGSLLRCLVSAGPSVRRPPL